MTPKDRTQRALTHQPVDYLPTQINYTQAMGQKMAVHFGVPMDDLPELLGNHLLRVDLSYDAKYSADGKLKYDWWGVGFDLQEEGYYAAHNPLGESKDLDAYPWPDPDDPQLLDDARVQIERKSAQHFVVPNFGWVLFERAWSLRGFETFLLDMALDPGFVEELLERIMVIQLALIKRFIDLGVDGSYFGDDYGAQASLLFSPEMWRQMIKPRLARLFAPFHEIGLPIIMHSDGQISPILPDLVEIGLTTLNPVQPEVLDHAWLKSTFGERLTYYGGISTQNVLPHGSPTEVKEAVKKCMHILAPNNTGLLVAPSHRMMADIPIENVSTLLEVFAEIREE
ncbi:MAG: uroporphyrinogen decarboxylase family protein [Anaerolineales bacterium]|jgi:uroporphyrinogen decarboxylase